MPADSNLSQKYLNHDAAKDRIQYLRSLARQGKVLPLDLVHDLLHGHFASEEHIALINCCDTQDKLAFEDMATRGIFTWNQNLASVAIRTWSCKTDCLLWHRTLPLAFDESIPQRVSYTLLDLAWHGGGKQILERFIKLKGFREMSPAFLALFFQRANLWSFESPSLVEIGLDHINSMKDIGFNGDRVVPHIISYFLKNNPALLNDNNTRLQITGTWGDIISSLMQQSIDEPYLREYRSILASCLKSSQKLTGFYTKWPSIWHRHHLPQDIVRDMIQVLAKHQIEYTPNQTPVYELLGGIPSGTLHKSLQEISDDLFFCHGLTVIGNLLDIKDEAKILESIKDRIKISADPVKILEALPQKLRIKLGEATAGIFKDIAHESEKFLKPNIKNLGPKDFKFSPHAEPASSTDAARRAYIQTVRERIQTSANRTDDKTFWGLLAKNWITPCEKDIDELATLARKQPKIYHGFYIETLGRFQGIDKAALKLLDYVRSDESETIGAVVNALAGINTQRSNQEIVAFLTRPNINFDLQMEIAQLLKDKDLSRLQSEIRSALDDIFVAPRYENMQWELKAALTDLLQVQSTFAEPLGEEPTPSVMPTSPELDQLLIRKMKDYHKLSSEAKRALRTAQFFQLQVESAGNLQTIDLSPAIDMQYKALELSFRENFESPCGVLINDGILQRKLDLIGYARPIKTQMDRFEAYIEHLPIIKDIPFFSHFKLRKMLRAICQFRRGKRFTLDGLKAFGLFFICFSRKRCDFGLENLFPVKEFDDKVLAEFVMSLHTFQDFRNRAAHEGFHPDASNNLDAIWKETSQIIETMFLFRENLMIDDSSFHAGKPVREVKIINKSA